MLSIISFTTLLGLLVSSCRASRPCPCGWRLYDSHDRFTHRLFHDFSKSSQREDLDRHWLINGYFRQADNLDVRLNQQFEVQNVQVKNGLLTLKQQGYSDEDLRTRKPISVAGIQSRTLEILHGSFRIVMKMEGATGGAVGSFFWYHVRRPSCRTDLLPLLCLTTELQNDSSEIDIEAITRGTSILNNTINYTSHPSTYANGTAIVNATRSVPLDSSDSVLTTFREHRFDCHPQHGTKYYLDHQVVHVDSHNIPSSPGNVQLLLWADGNRWWSGSPSTTDVVMSVKCIELYYNTSMSNRGGSGTELSDACQQAGGPGESTVCEEGAILEEDDPNSWKAGPSVTGGGKGVNIWRLVGREMLVGALLAGLMAWALF